MEQKDVANYDAETVIADLEHQLGVAAGQNARLRAVIRGLMAGRNAAARDADFADREGGAPQPEPATGGVS